MKALRNWLAALAVLALGLFAAFSRGKKAARVEDAQAADKRQQQADVAAEAVDSQVAGMTDDEVRRALAARARRNGAN